MSPLLTSELTPITSKSGTSYASKTTSGSDTPAADLFGATGTTKSGLFFSKDANQRFKEFKERNPELVRLRSRLSTLQTNIRDRMSNVATKKEDEEMQALTNRIIELEGANPVKRGRPKEGPKIKPPSTPRGRPPGRKNKNK
jgi:hypothetical protein